MEENIEPRKDIKREIVTIALGLQFGCFALLYMATPGYLTPFLNGPLGRSLIFLILLWQALGLALYAYSPLKTERSFLFTFQTVFFLIIFLAPFTITYLIAPAATSSRMMAM